MVRRGLYAGEPLVTCDEGFERDAQLVGLRPVFGIVDRNEGAARKRQRGVERFGLGAGPRGWGNDNLERCPEAQSRKRLAGLAIVGFDHEFDIELFDRVVPVLWRKLT